MQSVTVCPKGYFRRSAITFSCNASAGTAHVALSPAETREVVYLGPGVKDLFINVTSDMDVDAELLPVTNSTEPTAGSDEEDGNGSSRSLQDSDPPSAATERQIEILGTSSSAYVLRLRNSGGGWATVALQYAHSGTMTCRDVPVPIGCDSFEVVAAEEAAAAWGASMRAEYPSADAAWLAFSATQWELSSSGIPWFRWQAAWPARVGAPGRPQATSAGMAFHFLDTDRNGFISQAEFSRGYDGDVHWSISSPEQHVAVTPVGSDTQTSTSEVDSMLGWVPLGSSSLDGIQQTGRHAAATLGSTLDDIQQGKPEAQFLLMVFVCALFVLMVGSIWLIYILPRGSTRKTRSVHIGAGDDGGSRAASGGSGASTPSWGHRGPQRPFRYAPLPAHDVGSPRGWPPAPLQVAATPRMTGPSTAGWPRALSLAAPSLAIGGLPPDSLSLAAPGMAIGGLPPDSLSPTASSGRGGGAWWPGDGSSHAAVAFHAPSTVSSLSSTRPSFTFRHAPPPSHDGLPQ